MGCSHHPRGWKYSSKHGISSDLLYPWFQNETIAAAHLPGTSGYWGAPGCAHRDSSDGKANGCRRAAPTSTSFPWIPIQQTWTGVHTRSCSNTTAQFQMYLLSGGFFAGTAQEKQASDPIQALDIATMERTRMQSTGWKPSGVENVEEALQHLQEFHKTAKDPLMACWRRALLS